MLADILHDPRWLTCDVALDLGRQVQPDLPRRLRRWRSHPSASAARPHPANRARHGARVPGHERALADTAVPVPRTFHLGTADSPLGAPFYVMERVLGHICRNELPAGYAEAPEDRRRIGEALVDVLAALHTVDPAAVGLAEFGRPAGFMERQLRRWSQQWEASKTDDLPALDALRDDLTTALPRSEPIAVVHGDFRLDNTILHPTEPGHDRRRARLGDEHARRSAGRSRRAAGVLE